VQILRKNNVISYINLLENLEGALCKNVMAFHAQVFFPSLKEKEGIGPTITEFSKTLQPRSLVVYVNSTDRTAEIAKNLGTQVLF